MSWGKKSSVNGKALKVNKYKMMNYTYIKRTLKKCRIIAIGRLYFRQIYKELFQPNASINNTFISTLFIKTDA